jgi:hypothetical protein
VILPARNQTARIFALKEFRTKANRTYDPILNLPKSRNNYGFIIIEDLFCGTKLLYFIVIEGSLTEAIPINFGGLLHPVRLPDGVKQRRLLLKETYKITPGHNGRIPMPPILYRSLTRFPDFLLAFDSAL